MAPLRRKRITLTILVVVFILAALIAAITLHPLRDTLFGRISSPQANEQSDYVCTTLTPLDARPELTRGATGTCVGALQDRLTILDLVGDETLMPNVFDRELEEIVKKFQRSANITPDGVVGQETWRKLKEAVPLSPTREPTASAEPSPSPSTPVPPPTITIEPLPETAPSSASPSPDVSSSLPTPAYSVAYGPNETHHQVLTFDDCPRSLQQFKETITAAATLKVSLVLAPRGDCVRNGLFDVSAARTAGHLVINHSIDHPEYLKMSQKAIQKQLDHTMFHSSYGRPPYGQGGFKEPGSSVVKQAFAAVDMTMWNWSVDTEDWKKQADGTTKSLGDILATIDRDVPTSGTRGDTILMHMQHNAFNPAALTRIVTLLEKKGLSVCPNTGTPTPEYPTPADICQ